MIETVPLKFLRLIYFLEMKIKKIKVNNFKSLVDFELPLNKFSCLVGLNGSGKSTVLQFFDFLSQQV